MIGYGAAAILGLKGGRTGRYVTTKEGNRGMSFAWYDVPLQDADGRIKQIRTSGVLRTASFKNEGKNREALGDSPGGITGPAQLWECVDLVVGRDNQDRRPGNTLGWPGRPKGGCPVKSTGDPGTTSRWRLRTPAKGTESRVHCTAADRGVYCTNGVIFCIDYCTAPRDTQKRWKEEKETLN